MKRFLCLGFVLSLYVICTGCGETFRPIIIPNPPIFPNPQASHSVLSINYNSECLDNACDDGQAPLTGTAMAIDVSGDTEVSIVNVGLAPVHAVQQSANLVLVVNHSVTGAQSDSLTALTFSGTTIVSNPPPPTINLPPNSAPDFVDVAPSSSTAYVTLSALNEVGVVSTSSNSLIAAIPVGSNPYALAVTPDNTKLYVANMGDSTISGFNTTDRSQRVGSPVSTAAPPLWLGARSDNQRVYVLEQGGALASLDVTSTAGPDILTPTSVNVPGATILTYDPNKNRLYIPGSSEMAIVDVSQSLPQYVAGSPITTCQSAQSPNCIPVVAPASRASTDPCSLTAEQTLTVVSVTALPDGSRAYVGAYYVDASDNICPQVTVIDAVSNTVKSSVAVPGFPDATNPSKTAYYVQACASTHFRFMMASGGDSTRAYLSICDGGNVNIIDTSSDSYIGNLQAPVSARTVQGSTLNPPQNPVFLLAGP